MKKTKLEGAVDEYLDAVGQEDEEKASRWVIEKGKEADKQEARGKATAQQKLQDARKRKQHYQKVTGELLFERAKLVDWPRNWKWRVGYKDDDKVNLRFKDDKGNLYGKGIKLTGVDYLDLNAINILAVEAENTIDHLTHPPQTDSGIYLK